MTTVTVLDNDKIITIQNQGTNVYVGTVMDAPVFQYDYKTDAWQPTVKAYQSAPPVSATAGDRFAVQTPGSGAFLNHDEEIAVALTETTYEFYHALEGWRIWDELNNKDMRFAAGVWSEVTSMVYPGAGIAVSTGTGWGSSITDNSADWNEAHGWGNHANAGYVTGTPWTGMNYLTGIVCDSPLSGAGTSASHLTVDLSSKLGVNAKAADSSLLDGHNAAYFQVAGSYLTSESDPVFAAWLIATPPLFSVNASSPLSGAGTSLSPLTVDLSGRQAASAALSSIASLVWSSGSPFVKMTADGVFGLDTTVYVTGTPWTGLYLPLAGGIMVGNITFNADNTYDIGANDATRPRTGYFGTSIETAKLVVPSDGTAAFGIFKANGTTNVINVDTTNSRVGIGGVAAPATTLEVNGSIKQTGGQTLVPDANYLRFTGRGFCFDAWPQILVDYNTDPTPDELSFNVPVASAIAFQGYGAVPNAGNTFRGAVNTFYSTTSSVDGILRLIASTSNAANASYDVQWTVGGNTTPLGGIRFSNPSANVSNMEFSNWNGTGRTVRFGIYGVSGYFGIGNTNPGALLDIGNEGTLIGAFRLEGSASGYVQIQPAAAAGSWTLTLPASDGDSGQFLQTNGSGVTSWVTALTSLSGAALLASANTFTAVQSIVHANSSALTDFLINPAIKTSGNLVDWQINSVSKASIDYTGMGYFAGSIKVPNLTYITAKDAAGTGTVNLIRANASNEIEFGAVVNVAGYIEGPTNGGAITLFDMPVTTAAAVDNAEMSAALKLDGNSVLKLYSEVNGAGSGVVDNLRAYFYGIPVLTSTALVGSPIAGAMEFLTDKLYFTITSSSVRKEVLLTDTPVRGDLIYANSVPAWAKLAFPDTPTGKILQATATDVAWSTNPLTIGASASVSGSNTGDQTLSSLGAQAALNGTGFVKISGTTISYDNSTYLTSVTAHNLLSATHGDTTAASVARGSIITGQGSTPKWAALALGTVGKVLISDGTDIVWSASALGTGAYATIANYLPLAGGTLTGHLTFNADNTYDIGASGATRPRTGYFGTSVLSPLFTAKAATDASLGAELIADAKNRDFTATPDWSSTGWKIPITTATSIDVSASAKTFTRATGSFIDDGYQVGMTVTWSGFTDPANNTAKTITIVSALVMTVSEAVVNETATASAISHVWSHHVAGANATSLTVGTPSAGVTYQIALTLMTRTIGSIVVRYGGVDSQGRFGYNDDNIEYAKALNITVTGAGDLIFTPNATWIGWIDSVSVKRITEASAVFQSQTSGSTLAYEIRTPATTSLGIGLSAFSGASCVGSVAIGPSAGSYSSSTNSVAIGPYASQYSLGDSNTSIGANALQYNTGVGCTGIGILSLYKNTGRISTAIGIYAGYQNSGNSILAMGFLALGNNTKGECVGLGYLSLADNTGYGSTASGYASGYQNTGDYLCTYGFFSAFPNTGLHCCAFGAYALQTNSGDYSNGFGYRALQSNSGIGNSAFGYHCGTDNLTKTYCTFLGYDADIAVGSFTNTTVIGANARGTKSNQVVLGDANIAETWLRGKVGIGVVDPVAWCQIAAGTNLVPALKFTSGAVLDTPQAGAWGFVTDKLYFTITTGTVRKEVALRDTYYGEMYQYENVTATTIDTNNVYKAVRQFSTGLVSGFTFDAGDTKAITAYANYGGTVTGTVRATSGTHGLVTGNIITILGTTNYNGTYSITKIDDNSFYFTKAWVSNDATGNWYRPSSLKANTGSAGTYRLSFNITADGAAAGETYKIEANRGVTALDNIASERNFAAGADYGQVTAGGLVTVADGDVIWLSLKQTSAGNDNITIRHANMNIVRI